MLNDDALIILKNRYLVKDKSGRTRERPEQLFRRVARNISGAEKRFHPSASTRKTEEAFFRLMTRLEFLPNSPTLMNAGRTLQQLSACFVLPVRDSLDSIFEAVKQTALIHRSGGGTGFSFSRLRPKDDPVLSTGGKASGPVSFMRVFNMATEVIKQGGVRRGANMGVLRVDHPDILDFIAVKNDPGELTNFNLSVGATEHFMRAVRENKPFDLIHPLTRKRHRRLQARDLFDRIVKAAWATGEPGLLFLDRINRDNPTPDLGDYEATNPCGEQPLLPYESCNLGSINLTKMVRKMAGTPAGRGTGRNIFGNVLDEDRLRRTVRLAVRFLDNVIEVNRYPLEAIRDMTMANRKIGLGVMGFADFLILLGIPYDSERGLRMAKQVMAIIHAESRRASRELAYERGVFPNFQKSVHAKTGKPLRNATLTTIAPTGTLALIAGCSSGIEPIYGISTDRLAMEKIRLAGPHPLFIRALRSAGFTKKKDLLDLSSRGSIQGETRIPRVIRSLFPTAHDISPEYHIRMQAAFQAETENGVSKTVNFPKSADVNAIRKAFFLAHREGCKGVTVFRSGAREGQVIKCLDTLYC